MSRFTTEDYDQHFPNEVNDGAPPESESDLMWEDDDDCEGECDDEYDGQPDEMQEWTDFNGGFEC